MANSAARLHFYLKRKWMQNDILSGSKSPLPKTYQPILLLLIKMNHIIIHQYM